MNDHGGVTVIPSPSQQTVTLPAVVHRARLVTAMGRAARFVAYWKRERRVWYSSGKPIDENPEGITRRGIRIFEEDGNADLAVCLRTAFGE